ncbi:MAG: hypothetical protein KC613_04060 [Myxococcales bacterium]|nr:hypothetical protein [Myxococcales bacterium]
MRLLTVIGVLLALAGCDVAPPRIVDVQAPLDSTHLGPYRVTVLTAGRVDTVEVSPQPMFGVPFQMERAGDGVWAVDLPRTEAVGLDLFYAVEACGPGGCDRETFDFNLLARANVCLVDGDCPPSQICDRLRRVCKAPPAACRDDGDCPQDLFCPTPGDVCRFPPETCELDSACGPGRVCQDGRCVPRGDCVVNGDCAPGFVCDGGTCVPPPPECRQDADCPPERPLCIGGACAPDDPQGCRGPQDCPPDAPVCRPDGQCVPGELPCVNNECPAGQACVDGVCVPFGCRVDGDCEPGLVCADGRCQPPTGCRADGECGPDGACDLDSGLCAEGPRRRVCLPCADGAPCGPGLVCADFSGLAFCLPPCAVGGECPAGFFCDGQICQPQEFCGGFECERDFDCQSGVCQSGTCEPPQVCARNGDCAADRACVEGTCRPLAAQCQQQFDCAPGTGCLAGRCVEADRDLGCTPCMPGGACDGQGICLQLDPDDPQPFCAVACGQGGCNPGQFCAEAGFTGLSICVPEDRCDTGPVDCPRDAFEPNDGPDQPTATGPAFFASLTACEDPDWFQLSEQPTLIQISSLGPALFVRLRDARGRLVDQTRLSPGQAAELPGVAGGLLEVVGANGDRGAYELFVQALEPQMCDDDLLEPNDGPDGAVRIRFGAEIAAVVCPGNEDWYRLALRPNEGGLLLVTVDGPAALSLTVLDADGQIIAEGTPGPGEALPFMVFQTTGLRLACTGACNQPARYRLTLSR